MTALAVLGFAGACVIAVTSWWVGALRQAVPLPAVRVAGVTHQVTPPVRSVPAYAAFWVGLGLLAAAWLLLGHEVFHRPRSVEGRSLRVVASIWAAPLLVAAPVGSRDLWAYAAQANVATHHLNPYTHGPNAVPGVFSNQVSFQWIRVPSPYGPAWVGVSAVGRILLGSHPSLVAGAIRLAAASGLVLLAWTVPTLASRAGRSPGPALWLTAANPLFLIDGVAGGHNDLVMAGVVSAGLVAATSNRNIGVAMAGAGLLIGVATAVKLPAVVALPFLPMLWTQRRSVHPQRSEQLAGLAVAGVACVSMCAGLSVVTGYGFGWLRNASASQHSGGLVVASLIVVGVIVAWERSRVWEPLAMLTAAIVIMLMLVPVGEWWYWILPIAVGAPLLSWRATACVLSALSLTLLVVVRPDGFALHVRLETLIAGGLVAAWLLLDRSRPTPWTSRVGGAPHDAHAVGSADPPPWSGSSWK